MRILVISNTPPRADKNTMGIHQVYNRLRKLSDKHEITVAFTNLENLPEPETSPQVPFQLIRLPNPKHPTRLLVNARPRVYWIWHAWRQALIAREPQIYRELYDAALTEAIAQYAQKLAPDVVHVYGEAMLMNTPRDCPRLLADFPDLFSTLFGRADEIMPRRWHRWLHAREIQKIQRVERKIIDQATTVLFFSEIDRAAAQRFAPEMRAHVIPSAVDMDFFQSADAEQANVILFTGTLSYGPNIQALEFFVRDIFPRVQSIVPMSHLEIVGYQPPPSILSMENESIRVYANVPDVRPFFARATICIAPILSGSGTRNKIVEAWAMRKAVVSTRIGAEGLEGVDHEHLLLADEPGAFADAVGQLLQNPALRRELGENGHTLAKQRYSLAVAAEELNRIYLSLGKHPA